MDLFASKWSAVGLDAAVLANERRIAVRTAILAYNANTAIARQTHMISQSVIDMDAKARES